MTGWIRYRICDKSGSGWKTVKWLYEPWLCEEDPEDIREHIIRTRESWATYADSYSFESEANATPPVDVVKKEINQRKNRMESIRESISKLEALI